MDRKKIWQQLNHFQSANFTQNYLKSCYKNIPDEGDYSKCGYDNCFPFIYYLDHGKLYYDQASIAPLAIKPVLLFYGLVHLIKACLLTVDPYYPETTSVLAHGVTSRKKKKQQYQFIYDEVKIQKLGLFTHFSKQMFHVKHLEGEKFIMKDLLMQLPEMDSCFEFFHNTNMIYLHRNGNKYTIPYNVLDYYHRTLESFKEYIETKSVSPVQWLEEENHHISFISEKELSLPFRYHVEKNLYCLPIVKGHLGMIPELIIYYLLLYNLSMIARYETEWWSELIKTTPTNDYPLINQFLSLAFNKSPYLVYHYLLSQK
ncbi:YaaC family protein [Bacillus sp. FJAT-49736]|uniref:YaaC family protein n=1 Tax=Bacillus sp. FJAT-49736 TaxID=2833582 RepID=UPI0020164B49|nr:YaaC family protein [Bacillus sp. FJAT-49736]